MYEKFDFKSENDIIRKCEELGVRLPLSNNIESLKQTFKIGKKEIANRLVIQPMEGCDGEVDGSISELVRRRYQRFASSRAGIIWFEAVAINHQGRANPRQLYLHKENTDNFKWMIDEIKEMSFKQYGFEPLLIMQATHSGRYSKPNGDPEPIIAYNNPLFEKDSPIDKSRIVTDDELERLEEQMGKSARLAQIVGFDGVDIKGCHRYLNNELLSAYERAGRYGGTFENRTRFFVNSIRQAKSQTDKDFIITSRLNIYDGFVYPYGFGVNKEDGLKPDMKEPLRLVKKLHEELGIGLLNITMGNPYVNPHVNRPFNDGGYVPCEHPLEGVARMYECTRTIQKAFPNIALIASAPTYLREFSGMLAAGAIEEGYSQFVGFGRQSFAYPEFIKDLMENHRLDASKVCITCGKCSDLMRAGSRAGCVIKDREVYLPYYTKDVLKK